MEELETDIRRGWALTKAGDKELREDLYHEQHAIKAIRARLQKVVNEGKKAEHELMQQKVTHAK